MAATIQKSKQPLRRPKFAAEAKSPELRDKILDALKASKGGMTMEQIVESVGPRYHRKLYEIRMEIAGLEKELKAALNAAAAPQIILSELHDKDSGRIDAQKVAEFIGIPLKQLSEGVGLNYKSVHRNPASAGFQQALRPVKRTLEILHEFFGPKETIRIWLNTPHPDLEGATSLDTILAGKSFAVSRILGNAWNGVPI